MNRFPAAVVGTVVALRAVALTAAATPTFSPSGGTYSGTQTVTISDATPGAHIYFTTNGTTPTTSSTPYSAPIAVSVNTTLKAIAAVAGDSNSSIATAKYNFPAASPAFSPVGGTYSSTQTVTISDATPGAHIYFTTNGTTPTTSSTPYSGPITVSANGTTVKAIVTADGYNNSSVASATYALVAATPIFSLAGGPYYAAQVISISDATAGANIYYTTNGAMPTTGSTLYSGPITVSRTTMLQAIAVETGFKNSPVASVTYFITSVTAPPTFTPPAGTYPGMQGVGLSDTFPEAQINYTIDGTAPTMNSSEYNIPVPVAGNTEIQAIAVAPGFADSAIARGSYTLSSHPVGLLACEYTLTSSGTGTIQTPTFSTTSFANEVLLAFVSSAGPASTPQQATITGAGLDWRLLQRSNSQPGTAEIWAATTAIPLTNVSVQSQQSEPGFTQALTVVVTAGAQTFGAVDGASAASGAPSLTLTTTAAGSWFYAVGVNGTTTSNSSITPGANQTMISELTESKRDHWVQLVATESPLANVPLTLNDVAPTTSSWNFSVIEVLPPVVPTPSFSPPPGTYNSAQAVSVSDATAGAQIYYTTDGTTPTINSTIYNGPITISATTTLQAIANASGYSNSPIVSGTYSLVAATPTFSLTTGTYNGAHAVSISDATAGVQIYYTTDGTIPTTNSTLYSGPVTISSTTTLQAIAAATGYSNSSLAAATYAIPPQVAQPTISAAAGSAPDTETVTIADATDTAQIYYTTDGSTPTTSSLLYIGPITISTTTTIDAIAVAGGYSNSSPATTVVTPPKAPSVVQYSYDSNGNITNITVSAP